MRHVPSPMRRIETERLFSAESHEPQMRSASSCSRRSAKVRITSVRVLISCCKAAMAEAGVERLLFMILRF